MVITITGIVLVFAILVLLMLIIMLEGKMCIRDRTGWRFVLPRAVRPNG